MLRRDFLAFSAGAAPISQLQTLTVEQALHELEIAIALEIPDVRRVWIAYDPSEARFPLVVHAMR